MSCKGHGWEDETKTLTWIMEGHGLVTTAMDWREAADDRPVKAEARKRKRIQN